MTLIKQELRRRISETLAITRFLPPVAARDEIRQQLAQIQRYCASVDKAFIFVEQRISCQQFDLGGQDDAAATLFRGPNEDASVAICITDQGSLLHRSDSPWRVYRDNGDIAPVTLVVSRAH
ncbi:MAG: hypothetical protein AAF892_13385 [Cyanobacteria bacterium P01_D01_bin.71]